MAADAEQHRTGSQSIERALAVLALFADSPALGVTDISRRSGLSVSTAHRITRALVRAGFLDQDPAGERYRLGRMVALLGRAASESLSLGAAQVVLDEAAAACGEAVSFGVLDGDDVVILAAAESTHPLRFDRAIGTRTPAHASAIGKAILAYVSDDRSRPSPRGERLARFTERTIVDPDAMATELDAVRASGTATNVEERYPGVCAVAAPIVDASGHARAGVGVQVPLARFGDARRLELAELVVGLASDLAGRLPLDRL